MINTGDGNHNNDDDINNINNTNEMQQRKKGKGRQKISIEKIQNETNLQVTFSKRRAGVFKKASELSTRCGAECAVVVFSPANKPHSFGHPDVETVANRFLINASNSVENPQGNVPDYLLMANNEATMYQRNHELVAIDVDLECQKQRKKELGEIAKVYIPPLDRLSYEQLEEMKKSIESYKHGFESRLKSKANETMWSANQNPSTQQGLGFPAPIGYGYGATNIVPIFNGSSSSSASFGNQFHNFGIMQCPPMGPSGSSSNYGNIGINPATVVPYDGTWRASGSGSSSRSGTRNRNGMGTDEDPGTTPHGAPDHNTGFGGNYGNSF